MTDRDRLTISNMEREIRELEDKAQDLRQRMPYSRDQDNWSAIQECNNRISKIRSEIRDIVTDYRD
jgi:phage terminase small subunit